MTSSVPGSTSGCAQCPFGHEIATLDEEGGCGIIGTPGTSRADPSVSFTGLAVAVQMVQEVCSALGGKGPLYAGGTLSFDYTTGRQEWLQTTPSTSCTGHCRLQLNQDYIVMPKHDITVEDLTKRVATVTRVPAADIHLSTSFGPARASGVTRRKHFSDL
jgi:hypothetical protein